MTSDLLRSVARAARMHVAGASIALLVTHEDNGGRHAGADGAPQRSLATSVVVLDAGDVFEIATATSPRDEVIRLLVLRQADLTKANPFNATGATRPEMYFGRQVEEADLISTLASNSVAIIGGRRIGKTSLLQHAIASLHEAGDWSPYYADLQEVGDWESFADYVRIRWDVELPSTFTPAAVTNMARMLASRSQGRLVIALDEVDNLLMWDQDHDRSHVPEAFFRACRAMSRKGWPSSCSPASGLSRNACGIRRHRTGTSAGRFRSSS